MTGGQELLDDQHGTAHLMRFPLSLEPEQEALRCMDLLHSSRAEMPGKKDLYHINGAA